MKIVLDVSAAFALIIGSSDHEKLFSILESASEVLAPDLFYAESANTAWKFHQIEKASVQEVQSLYNRAIILVDRFTSLESISDESLSLACEIGHPVYDCYYLTLAKNERALILTVDKRLLKLANKLNIPTE